MDDLAALIAEATEQGKTLPLLGEPLLDEPLSLEAAYQLQHQVTAIRSPNGVAGVKAGVTAKAVQSFLQIDDALIASLYAGTQRNSGDTLEYVEGRLLECEVALKLSHEGQPLAIAPAFEIVAVRFAAKEQMTAANLVACNLGADLFVTGDFVPWQEAFNDLSMVLTHDQVVVNETPMSDALNGPGPGAAWMARQVKRYGFTENAEHIFMIGACGKAVPLKSGIYLGDYGLLGKVELTISE